MVAEHSSNVAHRSHQSHAIAVTRSEGFFSGITTHRRRRRNEAFAADVPKPLGATKNTASPAPPIPATLLRAQGVTPDQPCRTRLTTNVSGMAQKYNNINTMIARTWSKTSVQTAECRRTPPSYPLTKQEVPELTTQQTKTKIVPTASPRHFELSHGVQKLLGVPLRKVIPDRLQDLVECVRYRRLQLARVDLPRTHTRMRT